MVEVAPYTYRDHLVRLVASGEAAAALLAAVPPDLRGAALEVARRESARLSARLDASPLADGTADAVDAGAPGAVPEVAEGAGLTPGAAGRRASGWGAALKLEGMPTQEMAALEYANLRSCFDLEADLAADFFGAPLSVLAALQARLIAGLVDPAEHGGLRRAPYDIHDGAHGQVIFRTPPPEELPQLLEALATWLGRGSARTPALVVAGVVHGRLLEWQPYAAANGRLARSAARVVLRARGLDPDGLAVPERILAADPLGYAREVAASRRRRGDLTAWLERSGEALVTALEDAADDLTGGPPAVPDRPARVVAGLRSGEHIDLPEYAAAAGVDPHTAAVELEALRRGRRLAFEPGTQGLRFRRV